MMYKGERRKRPASRLTSHECRRPNAKLGDDSKMGAQRPSPSSKNKISSVPTLLAALLSAILICDSTPSSLLAAAGLEPEPAARFLEEPRDTVALVNQSVELACVIENKRGELVWLRNLMRLATDDLVAPLQRARYSVVAQSQPGAPEVANYSLQISAVNLRDDADFRCRLGPSIQEQAAGGRLLESRGARLTVLVPPEELRVQVSGLSSSGQELGLEWPDPSYVTADDNSVVAIQEPKRIPVRHGQRIRLECRAEQSKPHAELIWLDHEQAQVQPEVGGPDGLNGSQVERRVQADAKQPKLATSWLSWTFTVDRHLHSEAPLTCLAKHAAFNEAQAIPHLFGHELRQQVRLEVLFAPQVELSRDQQQAYEHRPLRFRCQADAKPMELSYRWFIDDQLVENATESELVISRVSRQMHLREVRCEVTNPIGVGRASVRLAVHYAPAFVSHLLPAALQPASHPFEPSQAAAAPDWLAVGHQLAQSFDENDDVNLRCDFDSFPRLQQVHWFKVNSDWNNMVNVTPAEADDLIVGGAAHAILRAAGGAGVTIDFEQMSTELLDELALFEQHSSPSSQVVQSLPGDQLSHTQAKIYEPLDWHMRPIYAGSRSSQRRHVSQNDTLQQGQQHQLSRRQLHHETATNETHLPEWNPPASESADAASLELELLNGPKASSAGRLMRRDAQLSSSSITVRSASAESVGRYVCKARLADASASLARSIFLVMRRGPRIVSTRHQFAPLGVPQIKVDCLAQINMVVDNVTRFVWSRNGKVIESVSANQHGRSVVISSQRSPDLLFMRSELIIHEPQLSDFGVYQCLIRNSIESDHIPIELRPSAPTGLAFAYIASLAIGSVLLLACVVCLLLAYVPVQKRPLKLGQPGAELDRKLEVSQQGGRGQEARGDHEQQTNTDCSSDSNSNSTSAAGDRSRLANRSGRHSDRFATIHESLEHKLQLANRQLDSSSTPPKPQPAPKGLLARLFARCRADRHEGGSKQTHEPASSIGKPRPSISLPVSVTSQRSALKRSSISTSLSALGVAPAEVSLPDAKISSLGCTPANNGNQHFRHPLESSSANLIQDSATGSDRSASGASSRSSDRSMINARGVAANHDVGLNRSNPTYGCAMQATTCYLLQSGQHQTQLQSAWSPSSLPGPQQLYHKLHEQQTPTGVGALDYEMFVSVEQQQQQQQQQQQSSYQIAGQPMVISSQQPAPAGSLSPIQYSTNTGQQQQLYSNHLSGGAVYDQLPQANHQHQPQQQFVDQSGCQMISGYTSQPLGWMEHNQSAPTIQYSELNGVMMTSDCATFALPSPTSYLAATSPPFQGQTLSNSSGSDQQLLAPGADYSDCSLSQYRPLPVSVTPNMRCPPMVNAGEATNAAFYESNYGTLISRASASRSFGYMNSPPQMLVGSQQNHHLHQQHLQQLPDPLQTSAMSSGSTRSSSISPMTTVAALPCLNVENTLNYNPGLDLRVMSYQDGTSFSPQSHHSSSQAPSQQSVIVLQSADSSVSTTTTSTNTNTTTTNSTNIIYSTATNNTKNNSTTGVTTGLVVPSTDSCPATHV